MSNRSSAEVTREEQRAAKLEKGRDLPKGYKRCLHFSIFRIGYSVVELLACIAGRQLGFVRLSESALSGSDYKQIFSAL